MCTAHGLSPFNRSYACRKGDSSFGTRRITNLNEQSQLRGGLLLSLLTLLTMHRVWMPKAKERKDTLSSSTTLQ